MPAIYPLRLFQLGIESTPGTPVPATWKYIGDTLWTPKQDRYYADYPRGVRADVTGGGVPTMRGVQIQHVTEITYEEIATFLGLSVAAPTITGTGVPYTFTYAPNLTGAPGTKTGTAEYVATDGSANEYAAKSAYVFATGFDLEWAFNAITKATYRLEGRAATTGITSTPSLTPLTGREPISSNLWSVYMDNTWAGLGTTQISNTIRSGKLTLSSGLAADYTLDGRSSYDFTQLVWGAPLSATLQLVMELTPGAATEIQNWQNQDAGSSTQTNRFIRLQCTSPNTIGTNSHKQIQLNLSMIYDKEPVFSQQNKVELATMELKTEYDPTSAKVLTAVLTEQLATLT